MEKKPRTPILNKDELRALFLAFTVATDVSEENLERLMFCHDLALAFMKEDTTFVSTVNIDGSRLDLNSEPRPGQQRVTIFYEKGQDPLCMWPSQFGSGLTKARFDIVEVRSEDSIPLAIKEWKKR